MFDLDLFLIRRFLKYELMARTTISLAMMCTRISIALFMLRFAATQIWFKRGLYCLIGLLLFSHITLMIVTLASCKQVLEPLWTRTLLVIGGLACNRIY